MTRTTDDDPIHDRLAELAHLDDPPLPELLERRVRLRARAELEAVAARRPGRALRAYRRFVEPALALGLAAGHLVWVLDAVASIYR